MHDCYVIISTYSSTEAIELPCYPDEISDNTNVNWAETGIIGRSSPIYAYNSTSSREVNFSFDVHREMMGDKGQKIDFILNKLRSAAYPNYSSSGLVPPVVTFNFGYFRTKGILNSIGFVWKKPIVKGHYQSGTVSVSMKETPNKIYNAYELSSALNPFNI